MTGSVFIPAAPGAVVTHDWRGEHYIRTPETARSVAAPLPLPMPPRHAAEHTPFVLRRPDGTVALRAPSLSVLIDRTQALTGRSFVGTMSRGWRWSERRP